MSISDELSNYKKKYAQKEKPQIVYKCDACKHPAGLNVCLMCEDCGRKFEDGKLIKDVGNVPNN